MLIKLRNFTESVCHVARDLFIGEAIHQAAKAKGIQEGQGRNQDPGEADEWHSEVGAYHGH